MSGADRGAGVPGIDYCAGDQRTPGTNKIPTSIVALVTSLILCPVALAVLCTYYKTAVTWYYIFASIIAAFVVYLVATGGWEKVKGIWDRTKYKDSEGE